MSAVTAARVARSEAATPVPLARALVRVILIAVGLLAALLLALSFVPTADLASRLLVTAGDTGRGPFAEELVTYLSDRLRFAAATLLVLDAGLVVMRVAVEELVAAALAELSRPRYWPRASTLALIGVPTLLAIALRIPFLGQPMRYDEALTFNEFASRPLYYGLSFYPDPNNHLLNTLMMHLTVASLGDQPWVLRLPAFAAGACLAPATYGLGRLLFGAGAAFLSAVLVAVSSYLVEYSTNARGYTLQALSFVLTLSLLIGAVRYDQPAALLLASLVAALGAYAVPTMLYGVGVAAVWAVIELRRVKPTRIQPAHLVASGLVLGLAVLLAYLPVVVVSGPDKLAVNRFVVPLGQSELASEFPRSLAQTWAFWNRDVPLPFAALLVVGFAIGTQRQAVGVVAVAICLLLVLLQRVAPFERVWLFLLPLYFAIASGGLARFVDGRLLGVCLGAVLGFVTLTSGSIFSSSETGVFPDAEAVASTLSPRLAPDDAVLTQLSASLPELQYYFPRYHLPTNVLVRSPDEAQNLWVIAPPTVRPDMAGWDAPVEVERYANSALFKLIRNKADRSP